MEGKREESMTNLLLRSICQFQQAIGVDTCNAVKAQVGSLEAIVEELVHLLSQGQVF